MWRRWSLAVAVAGAIGAGCGSVGMPVPVVGDVASLAGEWIGEYWSAESGRSGSIFFRLEAGADTARGDVIMQPATPGRRGATDPSGYQPSKPPEALRITFVRASRGGVSGRLDPYRDPDCGCQLTTTFTGRLNADTLSGTFTSYHQEMRRAVEGHWRAVRTR